MSGFTRFTVTVEEVSSGWEVRVEEAGTGAPHGIVHAPALEVALRMAVPYMAWAVQPNQVFLGGESP